MPPPECMEPVIPATLKLHNAEKKAAWLACLQVAATWQRGTVTPREKSLAEYADALYNEYLLRCPPPS